MLALLNLIPKWVWMALAATLAATSCKLKWDNNGLSLEVEKHATHIAQLETGIATANAQAAAQVASFTQQLRTAEQARAAREKALVVAAGNANRELDSLRLALASRGSEAGGGTAPTSIDPATPAGALLTVSSELVALGERCDRHVNDLQTLIAAWPR